MSEEENLQNELGAILFEIDSCKYPDKAQVEQQYNTVINNILTRLMEINNGKT